MMQIPLPPPWLPDAEMKTEEPVVKGSLKRSFYSVIHILPGFLLIGLGIFLLMVNSGSPYKEITGHVQKSITINSQDGQSGISYLQISTDPNDLFILYKNSLHPSWNGQFFKNERVGVYYSGDTPKRIGALQMYDLSGRPTTKFFTNDYMNSQKTSPLSNTGLDIGVILILVGAGYLFCWVVIYVKGKLGQAPSRG